MRREPNVMKQSIGPNDFSSRQRRRDLVTAAAARIARRMFAFSIFYLFILFAALLIDDRLASLIGRAA